jgi:hypothetical protein
MAISPQSGIAAHDGALTETVKQQRGWPVTPWKSTSVVFGGAIGFSRDIHGNPTGIRAHALVSLGAAIVMLGIMDDHRAIRATVSVGPADAVSASA